MRFETGTKIHLYFLYSSLFLTGLALWILSNWFLNNTEFGLSPMAEAHYLRVAHGVLGLWFTLFFGYLLHSHILPALQNGLKVLSGNGLMIALFILILTVPFLYYLTQESTKNVVATIHIYLGLSTVFLILAHLKK